VGDIISERATGSSKKVASQLAAELLIGRLKSMVDTQHA
jgi:hypothetical protein